MATRMTWAKELADRARAVGWRVDDPGKRGSNTYYQVYMPACDVEGCPHMYQIHTSTSDVQSEGIAKRYFIAHGLVRLERSLAASRKAVAAEQMKKERLAAERRGEALAEQQRSAVLAKVSGPYQQPEYVDDAWFIADHPSPWHRWVIMTPRQAKWLLDTINTNNRPLYGPTWDRYEGIILSKQWRWTHQAGAVDRNKVLQDGQHRLKACVEADEEIIMPFCVGMDPDNWKAIDEGLLRTAAQGFARGGANTNVRALSATVRITKIYDAANRGAWRAKYTNQEILDDGHEDIDNFKASALFGARNAKHLRMNASAVAGAHYLLRRANGGDNPYVDAFFRGLITERKLDPAMALSYGDPRTKLREYMTNAKVARKRLHAFDALCLTIIAWNHTITDTTRGNLRWASGMSVPRITTIEPLAFPPPDLMEGEIERVPQLVAA